MAGGHERSRGRRPAQALSDPQGVPAARRRPRARGRRRELPHPQGRDAGAGRRKRLRQDHGVALHPARARADLGRDPLPRSTAASIDLATLSKRELKRYRRHMQMVFQDPFSSLNPRMGIADIIGEPLLVNGMRSAEERRQRVARTARHGAAAARLPQPLSACVQRRPAPAHRHRARAGAQPEPDRRRRAGLRARRVGAGADPQPDARPAGPARPDLPVRRA